MPLPWQKQSNHVDYTELQSTAVSTTKQPDEHDYSYRHTKSRSLSSQDTPLSSQDQTLPIPPSDKSSGVTLGKPTAKRKLHALHASSAALSLICLGVAIGAVASEEWSWRLGVKNRQLIVLGFLLGIMNLCLASVTPAMFLVLEARFGPSTLQNYEGILRNQVLGPQSSILWRLIFGLMLALPLSLSVAYKTFTGGESSLKVKSSDYHNFQASYYGMFGPPTLQALGEGTGVSLFSNATTPFVYSSTNKWHAGEPALPTRTRAYGYNVLSLNNESTAMLDIPFPDYLDVIQDLLALGESWRITARAYATVATFTDLKGKDPAKFEKDFLSLCEFASNYSSAKAFIPGQERFAIDLVNYPSNGSQSLQYVAIAPHDRMGREASCSNLTDYVQPYRVNRQQCQGTWSVTRGGIELTSGFCEDYVLSASFQRPIVNNTVDLLLGIWYMPSLLEMLGPFATDRSRSEWQPRYMATSVAAMLWSRLTAINGAIDLIDDRAPDGGLGPTRAMKSKWGNITYEEAGLLYPLRDTIIYTRPTLRKSPWLYLVLAIQPVLTVLVLGIILMYHSTPVDKGFGLISVLSGVNRDSLDTLAGATLSGKLQKDVKLVIRPRHGESKNSIEYYIMPANSGKATRDCVLDRKIAYD